jgi:hypothetical protein
MPGFEINHKSDGKSIGTNIIEGKSPFITLIEDLIYINNYFNILIDIIYI